MKIFLILIFTITSTLGLAQISDLRGQRYCEALISEGNLLQGVRFDVYNNIGLNLCPQEEWAKLSEKKIKRKWDADFVKLNGPRFWTMDSMKSTLLNPSCPFALNPSQWIPIDTRPVIESIQALL